MLHQLQNSEILRKTKPGEEPSETILRILSHGLKGQTDIFLLLLLDCKDGKESAVAGVHTSEGTLKLSEIEIEYERKMKISSLNQKKLKHILRQSLEEFNLWKAEQFI